MKPVGIAQVNDRVAYRLDCADRITVAERDQKGTVQLRETPLYETDSIRRLQQIARLGIHTLICGGLSGFAQRMLHHYGIEVVGWVVGDAREVLEHYMNGALGEGEVLYTQDGRGPKRFGRGREGSRRKMARTRCRGRGKGHGKGSV